MARITRMYGNKYLFLDNGKNYIYLKKTCRGWACYAGVSEVLSNKMLRLDPIYWTPVKSGFGLSKNKFTAVRQALKLDR